MTLFESLKRIKLSSGVRTGFAEADDGVRRAILEASLIGEMPFLSFFPKAYLSSSVLRGSGDERSGGYDSLLAGVSRTVDHKPEILQASGSKTAAGTIKKAEKLTSAAGNSMESAIALQEAIFGRLGAVSETQSNAPALQESFSGVSRRSLQEALPAGLLTAAEDGGLFMDAPANFAAGFTRLRDRFSGAADLGAPDKLEAPVSYKKIVFSKDGGKSTGGDALAAPSPIRADAAGGKTVTADEVIFELERRLRSEVCASADGYYG